MLKTFLISFRLRTTYKTNSIIWSLKSIPLVKNLLPASLYASPGLKTFANILSVVAEFGSAFTGKFIYMFIIYYIAVSQKTSAADGFAHMLIFLTIIGGFLNTNVFNPTKDKYYAMFLMRMDAKMYTLVNYGYFLSKMFVGFLVFSLIFGSILGASAATCLAVPLYVVCIKLCFTVLSLNDCKKQRRAIDENKLRPLIWAGAILLLIAAVVPPYLGFALSEKVLWILTAVLLVPAIPAVRFIFKFDSYRAIYKDLLRPESFMNLSGMDSAGAAQQLAMQKKISADLSQTSNKSGYKYFNELFMKRHAKLLTRSVKRITIVTAAFFIASGTALYVFPEARPEINGVLLTYLPYFLFVMYLINRGRSITQAMFMNCDHSMLTYRFYRQPKAILSLFVERLKYIIMINLMPAAVTGIGLSTLLYITGGTAEPLNYLVLFVSIIAMSIFFSVHSMVLYYLLQPYNVNLENKSAAYGIINAVTYFVCYMAIQFQLPTLSFGTAITAFCILYAVAAFIIAYRLAPRTFKLRN